MAQGKVLIETYWNVKTLAICEGSDLTPVLIETYWNVKESGCPDCSRRASY